MSKTTAFGLHMSKTTASGLYMSKTTASGWPISGLMGGEGGKGEIESIPRMKYSGIHQPTINVLLIRYSLQYWGYCLKGVCHEIFDLQFFS